jgi:hypothetical protein
MHPTTTAEVVLAIAVLWTLYAIFGRLRPQPASLFGVALVLTWVLTALFWWRA